MPPTRRQMIFVPEVNPESFVFFFRKGEGRDSWSIRDYSRPGVVVGPRYADEFTFSLDELQSMIEQQFDAERVPTTDLEFWHRQTVDLNKRYLSRSPKRAERQVTEPAIQLGAVQKQFDANYPLLNRAAFDRLPKARKVQDTVRMLSSGQSEDWVTWNAFALLEMLEPDDWWPSMVRLARTENSKLHLPPGWEATPKVTLWRSVASPPDYESASRLRMRQSNNPALVSRSQVQRAVEGASEIDIFIENRAMRVFIEAKLGSDISMRTRYDTARNQIIRNVDCLLGQHGDERPFFWMLVRDVGAQRSYTQLMNIYRADPGAMASALPHQHEERVSFVAQGLSFIVWADVLAPIFERSDAGHDPTVRAVIAELRKRVVI